MRFVIGKLTEAELEMLKSGQPIITKMLLGPEDYRLFHYVEGDDIEAETHEGNRIWTTIQNMEIVDDAGRVIIIFTLAPNQRKK